MLVSGISGFRKPYVPGKNPSADLLCKWAEKDNFVWLVTEDILDEYKEVLKRLGVRRNLIGTVVNLIRERAEHINVRASFRISPDPKADPFCLCSEEGDADFIATLNSKDFTRTAQGKGHLTRRHRAGLIRDLTWQCNVEIRPTQLRTILPFCGIALRDATDRESSRYLYRHGAIC